MALLQDNKDIISIGKKEFNVLLNQQVSPDSLLQRTGLERVCVGVEGQEELFSHYEAGG
jgi:hypothetical protein